MFQRLLLLVAIVVAIQTGLSNYHETSQNWFVGKLHSPDEEENEDPEVKPLLAAVEEDNDGDDGANGDDDDDLRSEACKPDEVLQLNTNNFNLLTRTGRYFIMIFKSPASYLTDQAKLKWVKLAKEQNANGTICFSDLDCTKSKEVCHDLQIRPRPTFLWYDHGRKVRSYDADPELEHLKSFVEEMIASNGTFVEKSGARTRCYLTMNIITLSLNYLAIKLAILIPN